MVKERKSRFNIENSAIVSGGRIHEVGGVEITARPSDCAVIDHEGQAALRVRAGIRSINGGPIRRFRDRVFLLREALP